MFMLWSIPVSTALGQETVSPSQWLDQIIAAHKWQQAVPLLKRNLETNPMDFPSRLKLLDIYLLQNNIAGAKKLVTSADPLYAGSIETILLRAKFLIGPVVTQSENTNQETRVNSLNVLLKAANQIDPADPVTLYVEGMMHRFAGQPDQAEDELLRALRLDEQSVTVQQALVDLYCDQHQVQLATPIMTQMLDELPDDVNTLYLMGRIFEEKGDTVKALDYLEKSQKADPVTRPKRLLAMAEANEKLGKTKEAVALYDQVLSFWPDDADLWLKEGKLQETLKQDDLALGAYQKAYVLKPDMLDSYLTRAERVFWAPPHLKAIPLYREIYRIAPNRQDILTLLVDIHYHFWQEGVNPPPSTLDELSEWLRQQPDAQSNPDLLLADVEIRVIRTNGGSPTLAKTAANLAVTPDLKTRIALFLGHPDIAQASYAQLAGQALSRQQVQRLVLIGAWTWAQQAVEQDPRLAAMAGWVNTWAEEEEQKTQLAIGEADSLFKVNQPQVALVALNRARIANPLSGEVQFRMAKAYLILKQLDQAQKSLEVAEALGLPNQTEKTLAAFKDDMNKALEAQQKAANTLH